MRRAIKKYLISVSGTLVAIGIATGLQDLHVKTAPSFLLGFLTGYVAMAILIGKVKR